MAVDFSAAKLLYHPERLRSLLDGADFWPTQVELSPTMACNLECAWCIDLHWRRAHAGTLRLAPTLAFLQALRQHGTRGVVIEGGGEPLLHPQFADLTRGIYALGFAVGLTTNGVLLSEQLAVLPLFKWVRVSLDAYSASFYRQAKGRDSFDQVMTGLAAAGAVKQGTRLGVSFLVSPEQADLAALRDLTLRLRASPVDYVQYKWIGAGGATATASAPYLFAGAAPDLASLAQLATERFAVYVPAPDELVAGNAGRPCRMHAFSVQVAGNGNVFICCRLRAAHNDWLGLIGNLYAQTAEEIWLGPARQELRARLLDGAYTAAQCPSCRFVADNLVLDEMLRDRQSADFI